MTPTILNAPRTRRVYDHRLREHVVRCGALAVAKHVQIPRSTVSTWRRRGLRPVVTTEPIDQEKQNALDSIARWERRARVLAAVVRLLALLASCFQFARWKPAPRSKGQSRHSLSVTAFGLMEFADMSKVQTVDEAMIARTRDWLLRQQQADGSWKGDQSEFFTFQTQVDGGF